MQATEYFWLSSSQWMKFVSQFSVKVLKSISNHKLNEISFPKVSRKYLRPIMNFNTSPHDCRSQNSFSLIKNWFLIKDWKFLLFKTTKPSQLSVYLSQKELVCYHLFRLILNNLDIDLEVSHVTNSLSL